MKSSELSEGDVDKKKKERQMPVAWSTIYLDNLNIKDLPSIMYKPRIMGRMYMEMKKPTSSLQPTKIRFESPTQTEKRPINLTGKYKF